MVCAAALAMLQGCGGGLSFTNDKRLSFVAPAARQRVTEPVTVRWSVRDFVASGLDGSKSKDRGVFAVFVDRAPMPAGKDLKFLGRRDPGCVRDPRCPDRQYLADLGVFVTADTSVVLGTLPRQSRGVGDEQHYVNVVLLDGTGHRIGESAWYRPFRSKRRSS
jgi:hypothetical protein